MKTAERKKYHPKCYRMFVSLHIHLLEALNDEFYRLGLGEARSVKAEPSRMGFMWF